MSTAEQTAPKGEKENMTVTLADTDIPAVDDPAEMGGALLRIIAGAAADPRVDVAKMERLLDMQTKVMARAAEIAFNQSLARLKARLPRITKTGAIVLKDGKTRIAYARYEDIHEAVMPLLLDEGFTVSYSSELVAGASLLEVRATFRHASGHQDIGKAYLPLTDDSGAKNRVQGAGSILSYGKRYTLCQYLDIVTEGEDDDGMLGDVKPITEKMQSQLRDMIAASGANETKFLDYMRVKTIEEIVVRDFGKAVAALHQKGRGGK